MLNWLQSVLGKPLEELKEIVCECFHWRFLISHFSVIESIFGENSHGEIGPGTVYWAIILSIMNQTPLLGKKASLSLLLDESFSMFVLTSDPSYFFFNVSLKVFSSALCCDTPPLRIIRAATPSLSLQWKYYSTWLYWLRFFHSQRRL